MKVPVEGERERELLAGQTEKKRMTNKIARGEPTDAEVRKQCRQIGMSYLEDKPLLWIAREAVNAPLPNNWQIHHTDDGIGYYYNEETGVSSWEHPNDAHYRTIYAQEKAKMAEEDKLRQSVVLPATRLETRDLDVAEARSRRAVENLVNAWRQNYFAPEAERLLGLAIAEQKAATRLKRRFTESGEPTLSRRRVALMRERDSAIRHGIAVAEAQWRKQALASFTRSVDDSTCCMNHPGEGGNSNNTEGSSGLGGLAASRRETDRLAAAASSSSTGAGVCGEVVAHEATCRRQVVEAQKAHRRILAGALRRLPVGAKPTSPELGWSGRDPDSRLQETKTFTKCVESEHRGRQLIATARQSWIRQLRAERRLIVDQNNKQAVAMRDSALLEGICGTTKSVAVEEQVERDKLKAARASWIRFIRQAVMGTSSSSGANLDQSTSSSAGGRPISPVAPPTPPHYLHTQPDPASILSGGSGKTFGDIARQQETALSKVRQQTDESLCVVVRREEHARRDAVRAETHQWRVLRTVCNSGKIAIERVTACRSEAAVSEAVKELQLLQRSREPTDRAMIVESCRAFTKILLDDEQRCRSAAQAAVAKRAMREAAIEAMKVRRREELCSVEGNMRHLYYKKEEEWRATLVAWRIAGLEPTAEEQAARALSRFVRAVDELTFVESEVRLSMERGEGEWWRYIRGLICKLLTKPKPAIARPSSRKGASGGVKNKKAHRGTKVAA